MIAEMDDAAAYPRSHSALGLVKDVLREGGREGGYVNT